MNERIITLDWSSLTVLFMLLFAFVGWRNGWQRGLATLVAMAFAWLVSIRTVDFLIAAIDFATGADFSGELRGFFQIALYIASVIMVVVTFNSKVIPAAATDRRDRLAGISTGLLSGYFFVLLLLDVGREWIAAHVDDARIALQGIVALDGRSDAANIVINFVNDPMVAYDQLLRVQNLTLLFLLVVFFHGLLFALLNSADKKLGAT